MSPFRCRLGNLAPLWGFQLAPIKIFVVVIPLIHGFHISTIIQIKDIFVGTLVRPSMFESLFKFIRFWNYSFIFKSVFKFVRF
jgi:hypothetical protein